MKFFFFLSVIAFIDRPFSAVQVPKNRAKVVENYVLSAKFDNRLDVPQLRGNHGQMGMNYLKPEEINRGLTESKNHLMPMPTDSYRIYEDVSDDYYNSIQSNTLTDRDLSVPAVVVPPPPPPVPPPPVIINYLPAFFAVGLVTFLVLLNGLQTTAFFMLQRMPLYGKPTNPLGRRRRSASNYIRKKFSGSLKPTYKECFNRSHHWPSESFSFC